MKKIIYTLISVTLFYLLVFTPGCKKKEDSPKLSALDLEINNFIWKGMYTYYLWNSNVPALDASKYKTQNDLDAYLSNYSDHNILFNELLYSYGTVDKWSWIVDDYVALEKEFQGISKSMGFEFGLAQISNSNSVFGFVYYVVKGSPADLAGIKRGDVFIKIDDVQLTTLNYESLLYGKDSYSLGFADIVNNTITPNSRKVSLTATEIHENPIYMDTVYTVSNTKIGYLVYNGFMSNYDNKLNSVFKRFKDNGVQRLIVDLRYNSGGSGQSAVYLASMIYGTATDKLFFKSQYNSALQSALYNQYGPDYFNEKFVNKIDKSDVSSEEPINTLNLSRVYIITTRGTASASELVINGLIPYMNVVQIGGNTYGKYVGSFTLKDYIDNKGTINPNHKWALQPIVLKFANSHGTSDFVNGLAPTIPSQEDISNMSTLGNINETMLKATLDYIRGSVKKTVTISPYNIIADSKDLRPHGKELHFNNRKVSLGNYQQK